MRNLVITLISVVLTTVVVGNAYYQKKQFYPSVAYITKSNPSMAVIYLQAFVVVILLGKLMRKLFFGELRPVELEHLMERSWYAITETCLAFTVFRDDFNPKFLALFTLLLFLKAFHWLAEERVDYMERSPVISRLFHIRIVSLLTLLGALDFLFVWHAYQSTLNKGASVQLVFGFEYAILLTIVLNIVIKYAFHVNDFHELPWENKAVFLLYTELIMGLIKVFLYFSFMIIMVRLYTLPLFAFRPMYYTVRAFKKAVNDVIMSRRAIRNMNTLYPDATAEELAAMDNVCIICREEMRAAAKKLPCNHIFHTSCLRSWFQRQQTCPTCRLNILRTPATAGGVDGIAQGAVIAGHQGAAAGGAGAVGPGLVPPEVAGGMAGAGAAAGVAGAGAAGESGQPSTRLRDRPERTIDAPSGPVPLPTIVTNPNDQQPGERDRSAQNGGSSLGPGGTPQQSPTDRIPSNASSSFNTAESFSFVENIPVIPPFPYMPFNVPPPVPPPEGLSEEELRRLEQETRKGLEQRIRCLYTIQSMLDTAVLMMQQYCAAVAVSTNNYTSFPQDQPNLQSSASSSASYSSTLQSETRGEMSSDESSNFHTEASSIYQPNIQSSASSSASYSSTLQSEIRGEMFSDESPNFNTEARSAEKTLATSDTSTSSLSDDTTVETTSFKTVREKTTKDEATSSTSFHPERVLDCASSEFGSCSSSSSSSSEKQMLRKRRLEKFSKHN